MMIPWALCSARVFSTIWLTHNKVEEKTVGDRPVDPEAKALNVALTATPADIEAETFADTMGDTADETEVHTLNFTLPEVVA